MGTEVVGREPRDGESLFLLACVSVGSGLSYAGLCLMEGGGSQGDSIY